MIDPVPENVRKSCLAPVLAAWRLRRLSDPRCDEDLHRVWNVLTAVSHVVATRNRALIPGLGVFEWRPFRCRMPDGRHVLAERLWFRSYRIRRMRGGGGYFESPRPKPGATRRDGKEVSNMAKGTKKGGKGCKGGCCK